MSATAGLAGTTFSIDRNAHTISYRREFSARPQQVFAAWIEPEQVSLWWDPSGAPLLDCQIDLRVGGTFSFVNKGHSERPFRGVYREISPPERLVFEVAGGSVGHVLIESRRDRTMMTVRIECGSAEQLENFIKFGIDRGTSATLDNLVRHVQGKQG